MARLSFRCDDELLERVDRARQTPVGTVPRETWLRDAVILAAQRAETGAALDALPPEASLRDAASAVVQSIHPSMYAPVSSTQAKTGVAPRPKGGK